MVGRKEKHYNIPLPAACRAYLPLLRKGLSKRDNFSRCPPKPDIHNDDKFLKWGLKKVKGNFYIIITIRK